MTFLSSYGKSPTNSTHSTSLLQHFVFCIGGTSTGFHSSDFWSHMDIQQQRWSHQTPFHSKLDLCYGLYEGQTNHQPKVETPTIQKPTKKRPLPLTSPTPPKQCLSRLNGVEHLLNPTTSDTTSAGGRRHDDNGTDSPWAPPIAATSRPATLPPNAIRTRPAGDVILPSIISSLTNKFPHPLPRSTSPRSPSSHEPCLIATGPPTATTGAQRLPAILPRDQAFALTRSVPLLPSDIMTDPNMLRAAHPPPVPPHRSSPPMPTQSGRTGNPASQKCSPSSALLQLASTGERRSYFRHPSPQRVPLPRCRN